MCPRSGSSARTGSRSVSCAPRRRSRYAQERDLDLVEVAPDARPPVTRILDYSKYKYEQAQKQKAARKHQQQITIREIKFRPKIAQNDYDTKKGHVTRFLKRKDKVKITIMFRGREVTHPERGSEMLERLAEELKDLAHRRAAAEPRRAQHDDDARAVEGGPERDVRRDQPTGEVRGRGRRPRRPRPPRAARRGRRRGRAAPTRRRRPRSRPPRRRRTAGRGRGAGGRAAGGRDRRSPPRSAEADRRRAARRLVSSQPRGRGRTGADHAAGRSSLLYPPSAMPKMKTHSGAKKRFKLTAKGKVRARHSFTSHQLEQKSPKRKRTSGPGDPQARRHQARQEAPGGQLK